MTTALPAGMIRYTGASTHATQDATGAIFMAFQKQNNAGSLIVIRDGVATEIVLSPKLAGRPSLDVNPFVGLWVVGNQETDRSHVPQRIAVPEYVPFGLPSGGVTPQVIAVGSAIDLLYIPPYLPSALDTVEELTARFNKLKAAFLEHVALSEAAGVVRRA